MEFNGSKSELIHFNKGRAQWTDPVQLANPAGQGSGSGTVSPSPNARFLGVWLDWRLNWKAHEAKVVNKLKTQNYALSKIAAKNWGPGLICAREVYTKYIRSAIAYGAVNFHLPTSTNGLP